MQVRWVLCGAASFDAEAVLLGADNIRRPPDFTPSVFTHSTRVSENYQSISTFQPQTVGSSVSSSEEDVNVVETRTYSAQSSIEFGISSQTNKEDCERRNLFGDGTIQFMLACQNGEINIVKKVLDRGDVDVNALVPRRIVDFYKTGETELPIHEVRASAGCQESKWFDITLNKYDMVLQSVHKNGWADRHTSLKNYIGWKLLTLNGKAVKDYNEYMKERYAQVVGQEVVFTFQKSLEGDWTALIFAAYNGKDKVVRELCACKNVDVNKAHDRGFSALVIASEQGHYKVVQELLVRQDIEVNKAGINGYVGLLYAARIGHVATVHAFLSHKKTDVNKSKDNGDTALIMACSKGHHEVVQALIAHKDIDVNKCTHAYSQTPLIRAAWYGHHEAVRVLLTHPKIEINKVQNSRWTPLMVGAFLGHEKVVREFLNHGQGIDVNMVDDEGSTPLMYAARNGHHRVVHEFLTHGDFTINVNQTDLDSWTALMVAAASKPKKSQKPVCIADGCGKPMSLKSFGYDKLGTWICASCRKTFAEATERYFCCPEHGHDICRKCGDAENIETSSYPLVVQELLTHESIDVNKTNSDGLTALMLSASQGHIEIVNLLLTYQDVDINLTNKENESAIDLARRNGHSHIVDILQNFTRI